MPFGLGRKKAEASPPVAEPVVAAVETRGPRRVPLHGFTEDWRLHGTIVIEGRLLDTLNRREPISVEDVHWAPADGSALLEAAPGIQTMDPYDLIVVIATPDTLAAVTEDERVAHRVHKVPFDVAIEAPPYRVIGTIHLHPGADPDSLLQRSVQMFSAVTDAKVTLSGVPLELAPDADVVLVNRYYMRGVEQVDKATGLPHQRLPGASPGGAAWVEPS
jgi:hypothetical protein